MGKEIMIRDLTFSYGGNGNQLEHISLDIAAGEVIVMTGPSGSGKSSLTRVINGLIPYFYEGELSGEVFVDGKPLKKIPSWERGKIAGNVFQDPRSQFFANEVAGEIAFGCENYGYSHEDIQNHVHRAAADIKIQDILDHSLHSLSYGMRQKVAIASAEAIDPEIYVTLYELKVAFADHIMHIPLGYHLTLGSGKLRKIMDENIESVEKFIAHQLPDFVASLVAPLVLVIILLGIDWRYGVVCLVGIVLAFIVQFAGFNGEAKEKMHRFQTAQENMNSASVEYVRGMSEIKAFNQTADSFKRLGKSITDYTSFVLEYALGWQNCMPAFTTIINNIYLLLIPVGILIGMHTTDFREYSLTFIFYLIIVHAISGVLNKIMYISESFTQIDGSVERMDEILRIPALPEKSTAQAIENYGIAFRDVSFSYEADSQVKALSHVSFFADQGKVTAIVGPSGGGKSTIASLISRFYDVTDGSIQIGGVDIRDIPLDALMDKISFVFQDTFLFKQSILDNIRMGNSDATEEQVIAAAKAARCHEFIEQLPNGYQTVIGSTGVHLSGGERQRIAIARAIVKDAPIIVLDEATAFSDPENEYLIQKAFEKLIQNKTVVMIAHRLSTIRNAGQILVMEKGHLIESGTHDELLKKGGKYAQMWSSYTESINWKISTGKAV